MAVAAIPGPCSPSPAAGPIWRRCSAVASGRHGRGRGLRRAWPPGPPSSPAVIVGGGRVGRALQGMSDGRDVLVRRGQSVPADFDGPIFVCTRNDDLDAVLHSKPPSRWKDLVIFQNGMLEPWFQSDGLGDADQVLDKESFQKQMLEKLIWISAFMLVGARHPGAAVGVVEKEHRSEVERLIAELASAAAAEKGMTFEEGIEERLCAYSRAVAHFPTAVKERNNMKDLGVRLPGQMVGTGSGATIGSSARSRINVPNQGRPKRPVNASGGLTSQTCSY